MAEAAGVAELADPGGGRLMRVVGIAVSVALLAAVIWWASRQPAPQLPTSAADLGALGLAVGLYGLATLVRAERWRILLHDAGAHAGRAEMLRLTIVGYMGNNVLPARAGDVIRVVLGAARAATSRRTVVGTLLAERVLDIVVLATLFAVLAVTVAGGAGLPSGRTLTLLAVAAGVGLVLAGLALAVLIRRGLWARLRAFAAPMIVSTAALRGRHGLTMLGLTVVVWAIEGGVWGSVGAAAGIDMTPLEAMYLVALASMFSLIPSGPGYAGTQDAAAVIGVRAIGGTSAAAVSYLILVRFVLLVPITVAGLVLMTTRYGGLTKWRNA
jgi:uncharacterized membrane protein YbhN (UPF0104 family)